MMAKYLATSFAIENVVSDPRVMSNCLPISTVKVGRRDADDFERMMFDRHFASDDRALSPVFALPERVADDNAGRTAPALIVFRGEQSP